MIRIFALAALALSVSAADAATVTISDGLGTVSLNRAFAATGPYAPRGPGAGLNLSEHSGRAPGTWDDGDTGGLTFKVKADALGVARIALQDVRDTKNWRGMTIAGETVDLPSRRANGNWLTAEIDFGVGGLRWHTVTVSTTYGPHGSDGVGVKACRGRR